MISAVTDAERERIRTPPHEGPILRQVWRHLSFLHWPVPVETLAPLLPPGLDVDTLDGMAYVGVVPFTISTSRAPGAGNMLAPAFHETNLRTYVHRGGRDPGIWFFSLDAASRLAVAGARCAYGLPYFHADMTMSVSEPVGRGTIAYASHRLGGGPPAHFRGRCQPIGAPAPAAPGSRELFLLERYLLYAWTGQTLRTAHIAHAPFAVQAAVASDVEESLFSAAGLPPAVGAPPIVHYAREADVRLYRPQPVWVTGCDTSSAPRRVRLTPLSP